MPMSSNGRIYIPKALGLEMATRQMRLNKDDFLGKGITRVNRGSNLLGLAYALYKVFGNDGGVLTGWTGFNSQLHASEKVLTLHIGYLPRADASVTDLSTVYTTVKRCMKIAEKLNLQYQVLVFDKAIYPKVQQIHWKTS